MTRWKRYVLSLGKLLNDMVAGKPSPKKKRGPVDPYFTSSIHLTDEQISERMVLNGSISGPAEKKNPFPIFRAILAVVFISLAVWVMS